MSLIAEVDFQAYLARGSPIQSINKMRARPSTRIIDKHRFLYHYILIVGPKTSK